MLDLKLDLVYTGCFLETIFFKEKETLLVMESMEVV